MTTTTDHGSGLREHVAILKMRRLEIAAITVAVVAGALVLSVRQTPLYRAESDVLVKPAQNVADAERLAESRTCGRGEDRYPGLWGSGTVA